MKTRGRTLHTMALHLTLTFLTWQLTFAERSSDALISKGRYLPSLKLEGRKRSPSPDAYALTSRGLYGCMCQEGVRLHLSSVASLEQCLRACALALARLHVRCTCSRHAFGERMEV